MFLHLLSDDCQDLFLKIAHLVSISDNTLLWDGKTEAELTGDTNLQKVAVKEVEQEKAVLAQFARECGKDADEWIGGLFVERMSIAAFGEEMDEVWVAFKKKLKSIPLGKQNDPEERIAVSFSVLEKLHATVEEDEIEFLPAEPKVMLYELFLLALADGDISSVEDALLRKFADLFQIEEFLYDDLLERAQGMNHEAVKALSIILE
ncbi:hypothetical protein H7691_04365 [Stenotrophomonas sp. CW117]|jgi:hypothetical protein|uniref:hypothetical protein n=1 Tax=Stenotrophomonas TaxID=40323 RepID=UPI000702CFFF|nr:MULTISPECIES: hypothetical protein [Stenotrophomonas]KRG85011.1 hypothetical protein ABB33_09025 [Stenotrophomonas acidaminiphila]OZB53733.1 MAG: hypothetical protein B7X38_02695 [Stenotrophomonas sp. 14-69-23]QOF99379.1 hypothetical protein H7691_04365 [Stenotrophomonas sp. CW117]